VADAPAQHGSFAGAVALLCFRSPGGRGQMPLADDAPGTYERARAALLDGMSPEYRAAAEVWHEITRPMTTERDET
jgi:hypothetical protein